MKKNEMFNVKNSKFNIFIKNKDKLYRPIIEGEIIVDFERENTAGKMTFNVVKDELIDYQEGNAVILTINNKIFFYGYVFEKSRSKNQIIKTVCFDQLRYLKNKDTYQYTDMTLSNLVKKICNDRLLNIGDIIETKYIIKKRLERNKEYFEIINNAIKITTSQEGRLYTLYDNAGKICLSTPEKMKVKTPITYNNTIDFDYLTSINDNVYNRVKIDVVDEDKSEIKTIIEEDVKNIETWGVLQYHIEANKSENANEKAKILLDLFNHKYRKLTIKDTIGNIDVRAGSLVPVYFMNIGDISIQGYMLVERVTHKFKDGYHFMDLEVYNKDIMPKFSGNGNEEKSSSEEVNIKPGNNIKNNVNIKGKGKIVTAAKRYMGEIYSQAKRDSSGYKDCSSLVKKVGQDLGYLPKGGYNLTTRTIGRDNNFIEINRSEMQPGDIVWTNKPYGHMAIYSGNGNVIEASYSKKKVVEQSMGNRFKKIYRFRGK